MLRLDHRFAANHRYGAAATARATGRPQYSPPTDPHFHGNRPPWPSASAAGARDGFVGRLRQTRFLGYTGHTEPFFENEFNSVRNVSAQNFGIMLIPQNSADRQCQNCCHTPTSLFGGPRFLVACLHPGSAFPSTAIHQSLQKVIYAVVGLCVRDSNHFMRYTHLLLSLLDITIEIIDDLATLGSLQFTARGTMIE